MLRPRRLARRCCATPPASGTVTSSGADPGAHVLARVRDLPGGRELLGLASERRGIDLVGGAVRDLLLGGRPRELDVVVLTDDAADVARERAARLAGAATVHDRFGTASVQPGEALIDLAAARAESYAAPGALPDVRA